MPVSVVMRAILPFLCFAVLTPVFGAASAQAREVAKERRLRLSFEVANVGNALAEGQVLEVRIPTSARVRHPHKQVRTDYPFTVSHDASGNQWLRVQVSPIQAQGRRMVSLDIFLDARDGSRLERMPKNPAETELNPEQISDLKTLLEDVSFKRMKPRDLLRWLLAKTRASVSPTGKTSAYPGPAVALEQGRGDCTEMAAVFAEWARLGGFSATVVTGFRVLGSEKLVPAKLHNWVEVQLEDSVVIVDPFENVMEGSAEEYISFYRGNPSPKHAGFILFRLKGDGVRAVFEGR